MAWSNQQGARRDLSPLLNQVDSDSKPSDESASCAKCVRALANPVHNRRVLLTILVCSFLLVLLQINLAEHYTGLGREATLLKIHHLIARDVESVKDLPPGMFDFEKPSNATDSRTMTEDTIIFDLLSAEHPLEADVLEKLHPRKGFDIKPPLPLNPSWKNPCWTGINGTFHCFPYYYIIGFPRCGVRDLHARVSSHPLIAAAESTRPNWWTSGRAKISMGKQSKLFGAAVKAMGMKHRQQILGHADSTAILQMGDLVIGGPKESVRIRKTPAAPRLMTPSIIHTYNNQSRFIVLLRNPTEAVYSEYLSRRRSKGEDIKSKKSAQLFHYRALQAIALYADCLANQNVRACVYDSLLAAEAEEFEVPIARWLYAVYIGDWLQIFPRELFHFATTEEYSARPEAVLQEIFSFLDVGKMREEKIAAIVRSKRVNTNDKVKSEMEAMLPKTREKLDAFFAPFKKTLIGMLYGRTIDWSMW